MNAYAVAKLHLSNSLCSCHEFKNLLLSSLVCTEVIICWEYMSVGISLYGNRLSVGICMSVGISYTDATYNDKYVVSVYIYTN